MGLHVELVVHAEAMDIVGPGSMQHNFTSEDHHGCRKPMETYKASRFSPIQSAAFGSSYPFSDYWCSSPDPVNIGINIGQEAPRSPQSPCIVVN